ncbi:UNKNOWN [Stylonychia lemnae]|uniref:Cilium assembly protein DZIP1 N-terminal domain-containing protein n=1 Tax=Stylonychia lemnae TaxID=5949 RepID=A0A078A071_STYLE|nr:UNKNOWN [Stylonychia lemnae]|eukprot:CDW75591.1 UNKNOWN [Stylonychia lemnae]
MTIGQLIPLAFLTVDFSNTVTSQSNDKSDNHKSMGSSRESNIHKRSQSAIKGNSSNQLNSHSQNTYGKQSQFSFSPLKQGIKYLKLMQLEQQKNGQVIVTNKIENEEEKIQLIKVKSETNKQISQSNGQLSSILNINAKYNQNNHVQNITNYDIINRISSKEQLNKILSNLSNQHNDKLFNGTDQNNGIPQASTNDTVDQQNKIILVNNQEYAQKVLDAILIQSMAKINLRVIDGKALDPPELSINGHGLENIQGLRGQNDGIVYFGAKRYDKNDDLDNYPFNDYVFEQDPDDFINYFGDRHFMIQYDYDANRYLLRDSGMGSGTFLKIQRDHILKSGQLISIGKDLNFLVVIDKQTNDDSFVNENMFNENQEYNPNNISAASNDLNQIIQNISINFVENLLSKNDSSLLNAKYDLKKGPYLDCNAVLTSLIISGFQRMEMEKIKRVPMGLGFGNLKQKNSVNTHNIIDDAIEFMFEDREVDERFLHKLEVIGVLRGNLDPLTQYVDEIAYKNLDYKMRDHPDPTVGKMIKIQQLGVQYLLFLQELQKKKAEIHSQYSNYEKENAAKLKLFKKKQDEKIKDLERKNDHAEYMINIYEEKLKKLRHIKKASI